MTRLHGKKFALLLADSFNENEYWHQITYLKQVGSDIIAVGEVKGKIYKGKGGMTAIATECVSDIDPDSIDGIIIPGGFSPLYLRRSGSSVDLVRTMHEQGKPVGYIFRGAWIPVACGILKGKRTESVRIELAPIHL